MDTTRCPRCDKRLMAMTDKTGRTELRCLKCDKVDPMKTVAVKWAEGPLGAKPLNRVLFSKNEQGTRFSTELEVNKDKRPRGI